jgi:hypothetical protein
MDWKGSERKYRLLGVACCLTIRHLAGDDMTRNAIDVADRYANGQATREEAWEAAGIVYKEQRRNFTAHLAEEQTHLLYSAGRASSPEDLMDNVQGILNNLRWRDAENAGFVRDIFGNHFRSASIDPAWLKWRDGAICNAARLVYEERAFDRLPVLADALEDAGCSEADLLAHLRSPGPHVRGCWAVDLVLAKE